MGLTTTTMATPMMMAGLNFMRLATIGLASLYMIHLLALDYLQIQKIFMVTPGAMAAARFVLSRGKRDLSMNNKKTNNRNDSIQINSADFNEFQLVDGINLTTILNEEKLVEHWNRITKYDPLNCIPSLTCQLIAGAEKDSIEGKNIKNFIEFSYNSAPHPIQNAYNRGLIFLNKSDMCYTEYPFCIYSAKMMLKLLKIFIDFT